MFLTERKKLQHSLNPDVTTRRRGIHFKTLVFLYTFLYMHDLAILCNDKLCKSAFHKSLAKTKQQKKNQKKQNKPQNGHSTRRYWKELHVGSTLLQPESNLRLINNTLRQHQWSQAEPLPFTIQTTVTASEDKWEQNFIEKENKKDLSCCLKKHFLLSGTTREARLRPLWIFKYFTIVWANYVHNGEWDWQYENHKYFCNVIPLHYIPLYFTLIGLFSQGGLRNA